MIIHNFDQHSEEWLNIRLGKLTASHAQAIATNGKGLETLCFKKCSELMTGRVGKSYTNPDMERGNELESLARGVYELKTGNLVKEVGFVELDSQVGCSPDGLIGEDGLLELKCKDDVNFFKLLVERKVDPEYMWQIQMQMYITGRKWCDYVVYNDGYTKPLVIIRVERDEEKISKIKQGLEDGKKLMAEMLKKANEY